MSKAMFLLAMWSLGTLCIFCGRWCEQQGALVLLPHSFFTLRPLPGNQMCVLRRLQCPLVPYP